MAKTVTLRIEDEVYKTFLEHAEAEKRSLSSFIELAALQYARELEFVDIEEMNDILGDAGLVKRLKQGIKDANARRGRCAA